MDNYIGKRLEGRYDILELIGKGGMANVYRAHDIIDDRTVAVKILRDEYMNNSDFLRRFKNESKAIALLNHPNIVKVHDVSFSGVQSIVMEYIDGVTLKEYIEHTGPLPWKDAVHFTIQILHALQHAHDKGIVHRDIKPHNIMLLSSGEIKVTDFGIARFARSESRTISDRAIGSVHYISPEQAMGEYTDEKSDIYSTGIMLFEMLTGQLPFEADTAVSVAIKQVQTPIKNPRSINPSIPIGLEEITLQSVQKDASMRFRSAAEMIDALEQFKANPNIRFNYPVPAPKNTGESGTLETEDGMDNSRKKRKDKKVKRKKRKSPYLRTMFIITLIVGIASLGFMGIMVWLNNPFVTTGEATLPEMVGQSYENVLDLYPQFNIIVGGKDHNDDYPNGTVYEQKPRAGSRVKIGGDVNLQVSLGPLSLEIEDFSDHAAARVLSTLRDLGLEPTEDRVYNDVVPAGRVISTDPPAGASLPGNSPIKVVVSKGPEVKMETIPDVSKMTEESAIAMLKERGFAVGSVVREISDLPEGVVIRQNPAGGAMGNLSTPITLVVSEGGMTSYFISVPLPKNLDREVTVRARIGEGDRPKIAVETVMNPAQDSSGVWAPSFSGEPGEELRIVIYIDGKLYQEYYLDFTDGNHWITRDRSDAEDFQE